MTSARSCLPCRASKVKCDRAQPSCLRCSRRGIPCIGSSTESGLEFRDERDVARRNSQRARREGPWARVVPIASRQISTASAYEDELRLEQHFSWLNENALRTLPEPLKRDVESRAVDRFFLDWVLYPGNDGISAGHMHILPMLYYASRQDSLLWHAVRAMAFADTSPARSGGGLPFNLKARRSYGLTLARLREVVEKKVELNEDHVFAALLLLDSFESMYLAQSEPLGPHIEAVKYLMKYRGDEQLYSPSQYSLWRMANCRLQARQIQTGDGPDPTQARLINQLNPDQPDAQIVAYTMQSTALRASARRLLDGSNSDLDAYTLYEECSRLINAIDELVARMKEWRSTITGVWQPKIVEITNQVTYFDSHDHPLTVYDCWMLHCYPNVWFAYTWNTHLASNIALCESYIALLECRAGIQEVPFQECNFDAIHRAKKVVEQLGAAIVCAIPPLVGFTDASGEQVDSPISGKVAGRFLAMTALSVVQRARYTLPAHKKFAERLTKFIHEKHALP